MRGSERRNEKWEVIRLKRNTWEETVLGKVAGNEARCFKLGGNEKEYSLEWRVEKSRG